jgi:hypothetical protein
MFLPFHESPKPAKMLEPDLREELRQVLAELREFDGEAQRLRSKYRLRFDGLGRIRHMECALCETFEVHTAWRALQQKARPRLLRFYELQRALAERKPATCPPI